MDRDTHMSAKSLNPAVKITVDTCVCAVCVRVELYIRNVSSCLDQVQGSLDSGGPVSDWNRRYLSIFLYLMKRETYHQLCDLTLINKLYYIVSRELKDRVGPTL